MSFRRWCPCCLGENYYQAIARELLQEIWSLCACILPSPRRCPICCEILDSFGIIRLEGGGYISKIGYSRDDLGRGVFNPSVFSSAPDQAHQDRTDFKGETVLDHMVFWFGSADQQVKTRQSPFSLWDLAGKALLTPVRKEAECQFKCH